MADDPKAGSRLFLALAAVVYAACGVLALVQPAADPALAAAARANGGLLIGAALLFGWCTARADRAQSGFVAAVLLTGPMLVARVAGLLADGAPSFANFAHAIAEIFLLSIAVGILTLPRHVTERIAARRRR
jgi:succinate dehydrogenase/fumarate reductase cytochrome b subunit